MKIQNYLIAVIFFSFFGGVGTAQNANVLPPVFKTAANANTTQAVPTPTPFMAKVSGRVLYQDTGRPLRRGSINLLKIEKNESGIEAFQEVYETFVITNDEGEFKMENVSPGEYYSKFNVSGVLNIQTFKDFFQSYEKIYRKEIELFFEKITVIDGVPEQEVLIYARRGGALSGRVLYDDGEPVISAEVELFRKNVYGFETSTKTEKVKTDDRGFYRFNGLPNGEYTICITEKTTAKTAQYGNENPSEIKTYYGNVTDINDAQKINLSLSEEKNELNFSIQNRKTYDISGITLSKTNKLPIENCEITFTRKDTELLDYVSANPYSRRFRTDKNGKFKVSDLPKGTYIFTFAQGDYSKDDNEGEKKDKKKESGFALIKKEFTIDDKNLDNLIVELPSEATLSGTVRFENKAINEELNLYISVKDEEQNKEFSASDYFFKYDSKRLQASFTIKNIPQGKYAIIVSHYGSFPQKKETIAFVKSINLNGTNLVDKEFEIKEGEEVKGLEIVLSDKYGSLEGKLKVKDNKRLTDFWAMAVPLDKMTTDSFIVGAPISEDGDFTLTVSPGDYYLIVQPRELLFKYRKLKMKEWMEKVSEGAEKITVKDNETVKVKVEK